MVERSLTCVLILETREKEKINFLKKFFHGPAKLPVFFLKNLFLDVSYHKKGTET